MQKNNKKLSKKIIGGVNLEEGELPPNNSDEAPAPPLAPPMAPLAPLPVLRCKTVHSEYTCDTSFAELTWNINRILNDAGIDENNKKNKILNKIKKCIYARNSERMIPGHYNDISNCLNVIRTDINFLIRNYIQIHTTGQNIDLTRTYLNNRNIIYKNISISLRHMSAIISLIKLYKMLKKIFDSNRMPTQITFSHYVNPRFVTDCFGNPFYNQIGNTNLSILNYYTENHHENHKVRIGKQIINTIITLHNIYNKYNYCINVDRIIYSTDTNPFNRYTAKQQPNYIFDIDELYSNELVVNGDINHNYFDIHSQSLNFGFNYDCIINTTKNANNIDLSQNMFLTQIPTNLTHLPLVCDIYSDVINEPRYIRNMTNRRQLEMLLEDMARNDGINNNDYNIFFKYIFSKYDIDGYDESNYIQLYTNPDIISSIRPISYLINDDIQYTPIDNTLSSLEVRQRARLRERERERERGRERNYNRNRSQDRYRNRSRSRSQNRYRNRGRYGGRYGGTKKVVKKDTKKVVKKDTKKVVKKDTKKVVKKDTKKVVKKDTKKVVKKDTKKVVKKL